MNEQLTSPPTPRRPHWGFWATIGFTALILLAGVVVSMAVAAIYVPIVLALDPGRSEYELWVNLGVDGCYLSFYSVIEGPIVLGMIVLFIKFRRGLSLGAYLSLTRFSRRHLVLSILIILGLALVYDGVSVALDRPILPEFMIAIYETACFRPFLYFVVIVIAPVLEEVLFRGFMFEGIRQSRLGAAGAILLTSAVWASLHLQYDLFDVGALFILGIVLGLLKVRSNSLYLPIFLHALINLLATIQLIVYMNYFHNGA